MEEIKYTFRNNGLGVHNDDVFDQVFDLTNNGYTFSIKPGSKTRFWRFGFALSELQTFEFSPGKGRYDNKLLKYIEIDVGQKPPDKVWERPGQIDLAARGIDGYEGFPRIKETYIENSELEIRINLDSSGNVAVSYFSQSANDSETYPIFRYNYFKVFAWADELEFEIGCAVKVVEKFQYESEITGESTRYWLLNLAGGWDKNLLIGKPKEFSAHIYFEDSDGIQQVIGPDFDAFKKIKVGDKGVGYSFYDDNFLVCLFGVTSSLRLEILDPTFEFEITSLIDPKIPVSEFKNEIAYTNELDKDSSFRLLELAEDTYNHILDRQDDPHEDNVDILNDSLSKEDLLARIPFVNALADHIERLWQEQPKEAYTIHLGGEWGSGKSNVLSFLESRLEKSKKNDKKKDEVDWLVVRYNAWENQHINPPWWIFMNNVYQEIIKKENFLKRLWIWLQEQWWRTIGIKKFYWVMFIFFGIITWSFILHFKLLTIYSTNGIPKPTDDLLKAIVTIFSILGTFWIIFKGVSNSLLPGSSEAALYFQKNIRDPMETVKKHFRNVISYSKKNVAIFIDDIDRCSPENTVNLLEGIQTLFKSTKVLYVVSGDGNWIRQCFELNYEKFKNTVEKPGYTLGNFFQEKIFQMNVNVPVVSESVIKSFWKFLIKNELKAKNDPEQQKELKLNQARSAFRNKITEMEINKIIESKKGKEDEVIYRQAAVEQISKKEVLKDIKHTLETYTNFLPHNPRALKRLINNYALARQTLILQGTSLKEVNTDSLVRWLLLCSKFPQYAENISKNPDDLQNKDYHKMSDFSELVNYNLNKEVIRAIIGK
jgi:hypothetical protein